MMEWVENRSLVALTSYTCGIGLETLYPNDFGACDFDKVLRYIVVDDFTNVIDLIPGPL